ncbi:MULTISPECIES: hypothetical protein [unclassified Streptomyces]|uniref:hypothetical protein n=1 Tax=unclassified Streptomyces TaxID=2593676 RepID=UPI001CBC8F85|nr:MULTISPECIES: hypothetical protein [unclassified Streptomyces]WPO76653.1 hypothetical protein R9806_39120 [Streptomyces sp. KN37]
MSVEGAWDLAIPTRNGKIKAGVELRERVGTLTGVAHGSGEEVSLADVTLAGDRDRLTWKQAITKPMRLNMTFDVTVHGDTLPGTSKAGRPPSSEATGTHQTTLKHPA